MNWKKWYDPSRKKGLLRHYWSTRRRQDISLFAGERRWRAAQKAGLRRIPVVVREVTPTESLELALIENIHRKDLNPIEEAFAYAKLLEETRITQDVLAKRLGKDRSSITNLFEAPEAPGTDTAGCD